MNRFSDGPRGLIAASPHRPNLTFDIRRDGPGLHTRLNLAPAAVRRVVSFLRRLFPLADGLSPQIPRSPSFFGAGERPPSLFLFLGDGAAATRSTPTH